MNLKHWFSVWSILGLQSNSDINKEYVTSVDQIYDPDILAVLIVIL